MIHTCAQLLFYYFVLEKSSLRIVLTFIITVCRIMLQSKKNKSQLAGKFLLIGNSPTKHLSSLIRALNRSSTIHMKSIPHHLDHLNQVDYLLPCCSSSGERDRANSKLHCVCSLSLQGLCVFDVLTSENLSKLAKSSSESSSQFFHSKKFTPSQLN